MKAIIREFWNNLEMLLTALLAGVVLGSLFLGCGEAPEAFRETVTPTGCTQAELDALPGHMDYCHDASGALGWSVGQPCLAPANQVPASPYAFRECSVWVDPGPDIAAKNAFTMTAYCTLVHSCDECVYATPDSSQ